MRQIDPAREHISGERGVIECGTFAAQTEFEATLTVEVPVARARIAPRAAEYRGNVIRERHGPFRTHIAGNECNRERTEYAEDQHRKSPPRWCGGVLLSSAISAEFQVQNRLLPKWDNFVP